MTGAAPQPPNTAAPPPPEDPPPASAPTAFRSWLAERFCHALHEWHDHLLVAAMLASLTLAAAHFGWLDWLDAVMLRVAAPLAAESSWPPDPNVVPVLIGPGLYHGANGFKGISPLDAKRLAPILQAVMEAKPLAVAIDLQLEPGMEGVDDPSWAEQCKAGQVVACLLLRPPSTDGKARQVEVAAALGAPATAEAGGPGIVLPLPRLSDDAGNARALAWMRGLCAKGVVFSSPDLRSHVGKVVRFDWAPGLLSYDIVAAASAHAAGTPSQQGHGGSFCGEALKLESEGPEGLPLLHARAARQQPDVSRTTKPLYPSGMVTVSRRALMLVPCPPALGAAPNAPPPGGVATCAAGQDLGGRGVTDLSEALKLRRGDSPGKPLLIILGGDYDARDQFSFLDSRLAGAVVHAAAIASLEHSTESHLVGWLIDIVIGLLSGTLLLLCWNVTDRWRHKLPCDACGIPRRSHGTAAAVGQLPPTGGKRWGHLLLACCRDLAAPLLPWLTALAACLLATWASGFLLALGWWINPGPVILGMLIHTLLEKEAAGEGKSAGEDHAAKAPGPLFWVLPYLEEKPMRLVHALTALTALAYLAAHFFLHH